MKYIVFAFAVLGVPPLAMLLWFNLRWSRYAIWGIMVSLCLYQATAINFFSHEDYHGSARGMEVSLIHLISFALLLALAMRRRIQGWLPDGGFRIYAVYFLLCLPSLSTAESCLISWLEIWKMILLFVTWFSVYTYLRATDDVKSIMVGFALTTLINFFVVTKMHYSGVYQPSGVFPHRNCMAMAMNLLGMLFFANYLVHGIGTWTNRLMAIAFVVAVIASLWSYSRGAIAVAPIGYGITMAACLLRKGHRMTTVKRVAPIVLVGVLGILAMLPRLIERFEKAPKASGDTRVELAYCALEMIKDEPLRGVGINNWSLKMGPSYPYQENASDIVGRKLNYSGIVETVYLLVCAECGIPALVAMLAWFLWYWVVCLKLLRRLAGTRWYFLPAGLLGGLTANYMQSVLEWVLRQQMNLICLMFMFAILSYLNKDWRRLQELERS